MNSYYLHQFQQSLKTHTGATFMCNPMGPCFDLGDYGPVIEGQFRPKGNIFDELGLDKHSFLFEGLDDSPLQHLILTNPEVRWGEVATIPACAGFEKVLQDVYFLNGEGFLAHLPNLQNEILKLDEQVSDLIQSLILSGKWNVEDRLVFQREFCPTFRAFQTVSDGGKACMARLYADDSHYMSCLDLHLPACHGIVIDDWLIPKAATPAISLVAYEMGTGLRVRNLEGMDIYADLHAVSCEYFVMTNI